jgi:hypothetical protein
MILLVFPQRVKTKAFRAYYYREHFLALLSAGATAGAGLALSLFKGFTAFPERKPGDQDGSKRIHPPNARKRIPYACEKEYTG